jgi:hypothetical protein
VVFRRVPFEDNEVEAVDGVRDLFWLQLAQVVIERRRLLQTDEDEVVFEAEDETLSAVVGAIIRFRLTYFIRFYKTRFYLHSIQGDPFALFLSKK